MNILRDPRWGRNQVTVILYEIVAHHVYVLSLLIQETYGEDPWFSAHLGTAYVKGLQGGKCLLWLVYPHKLIKEFQLET